MPFYIYVYEEGYPSQAGVGSPAWFPSESLNTN